MRFFPEKTYHYFFRGGIVLKAAIGVFETVSGFALMVFSYDTLSRFAMFFLGDELREDQRDFIWTHLVGAAKDFSITPRSVWVFILLSHGIVKLFLIYGLWHDRKWSYPASAAVFALFVLYQAYQIALTPSVFLWGITAFDILLIGLILHEYNKKKKHGHWV